MSGNNLLNETLPAPGKITCTDCGAAVHNTLHKSALAFSCPDCFKYFVLEKGLGYKYRHAFEDVVYPDLPLNTRGKINGVMYEIVGFVQKRQVGTRYDWREYTLYNPVRGFANLAEFNGHWNFIEPLSDYPRDVTGASEDLVSYGDREYQLYNRYHASVKFAMGEFPYNIFTDKEKNITEWIAPPFILLREKSDDEELWFIGEYMTNADLKAAFGDHVLPEKSGVGATQLMKLGISFRLLISSTLVFWTVLLIGGVTFAQLSKEKKVFAQTYNSTDVNPQGVIVTPPFQLTGGTSALQYDIYASIRNDWFDVDIELINDATGDRFEVAKSLEFYSGYDDGPWTEGSESDYIIVSSVPDGTYHLNLYPQWNPGTNHTGKPFQIKVFRSVPLWANFWLFFIISLVIPLIQYLRLKAFETRRWMESDYTPKSNSILYDR